METERLNLRLWQITDLDDLYEYAHDERVGPMAGWKPHDSITESEQILNQFVTQEHHWAIVLKKENKVIGAVKLNPDENRGRYFAKSISFALSPKYWGQGIMTEAVSGVMDYAFRALHIDLLSAFHYVENVRSKRVIEKCGFTYEITLPKSVVRYDGQRFDMACYSILKEDYMQTNRFSHPL